MIAVLAVMTAVTACDSDEEFPDDNGTTSEFPEGTPTWTDEEENSDGSHVCFHVFAPEEVVISVSDKGNLRKESEYWLITGSNEIEIGIPVPRDKFFVNMQVDGYAETLNAYSYDAASNRYTGRLRLRGDVTLTPEFIDIPAPETGDYYYEDGTWAAELLPDKQCIGIVFATGRHEHDSQQYEGLADIRGYAVAIRNADPEKQRNTFGRVGKVDISDLNDDIEIFAGYTSTRKMEQQPEYSYENFWACWSATHHVHPAPATSSGWYLPSFGEMNVLYSVYHETIRKRILAAEGGEDMDNDLGYYWAMGIKAETDDFSHVDFRETTQAETFADRIKTKPLFAYTRPILTF